MDPLCGMLGNLGSILDHPSTSWEAPWEPMGPKCSKSLRLRTTMKGPLGASPHLGQHLRARCSKSLRLRTGMKGSPGPMGTSWEAPWSKKFKTTAPWAACWRQMFRITTPAHKNKGHLGHLGTSWEAPRSKKFKTTAPWAACWRQMFRITAPAHKNEGAPRMPQHISESLREPYIQNHCACA